MKFNVVVSVIEYMDDIQKMIESTANLKIREELLKLKPDREDR